MYPPQNTEGNLKRRIHIALARGQSGSLEDAMNSEIDVISQRAPAWGSWNDRSHLLGTHTVVTRSGIKGLAAEFGWKIEGKKKYSINKFYFRNGKEEIFLVCAHVYGDEEINADFEKIILEQLNLSDAHAKKPNQAVE